MIIVAIFCLQMFTIFRLDFILMARGQIICEKLSDIDLRNHKAFMNFVQVDKDGINYGVTSAFDRNLSTRVSTYDKFETGAVPSQYLDNGYNWVLVELDTTNFQMVDSITLLQRTDIGKPTLMRISEIEVLVSNKIDNYPTSYTNTAAGTISWKYFVTCGTTGNATGNPTVICSQNVIDSNYVAIRRNRESGFDLSSYCCFDFAEFKVDLAIQLDQPKISTLPWIENSGALITTSTTKDCLLPYKLRLIWTLNMFNGSKLQLSGSSSTLTIPNLSRLNSGTYYYTVYNANGDSIFQSSSTDQIYVMYKSVIRNSAENYTYYENNNTMLSCSASGGYPYPTKISTQLMSNINAKTQFNYDKYYGKEAASSLQITANRSMNSQNFSCILQQPNFPDTSNTVPINIYYGAGTLIVSNTSTKLYEGDIFRMNCSTSSSGYPAPMISISVENTMYSSSGQKNADMYGGASFFANLFIVATKELHGKQIICTLQQGGFQTQSKSLTMEVFYSAGSLIVSNTNTRIYEGDMLAVNCSTSSSGYPAPTISITIGNSSYTTSNQIIYDKYGGSSFNANLNTIARKEFHNQLVKCTLQQIGFQSQSKSITLQIFSSAGPLIVSHTNTQINEGDIFAMNCSTSNPGYPAPTISITIGDSSYKTSSQIISDMHGGSLLVANLSIVARKEFHNQPVTCTLQQTGFQSQSKSLTLEIHYTPALCNTICVIVASCAVTFLTTTLIIVGALLVIKHCRRTTHKTDAPLNKKILEKIEEVSNPIEIQKKRSLPKIKDGCDDIEVKNRKLDKCIENVNPVYDEPNRTTVYENEGQYVEMSHSNSTAKLYNKEVEQMKNFFSQIKSGDKFQQMNNNFENINDAYEKPNNVITFKK